MMVAKEIYVRCCPPVRPPPDHLSEDVGLEKVAEQGRSLQVFRASKAGKEAAQTGIEKVEFGRLDQPFTKIPEEGRKQKDNVRGFKN